ncbi:gas vesicle protein [Streptomyces montanisoli]|uniref:Gas vesicle protein n=1 Tax=Streptomyces montanisoli TaxID=2798581 RepID=A0A940RWQ2_9ACTN|nr:gas vesicle protein [Streptomyces montanisoli]MBP0456834.1 gas vesicle protein [Streptomyces montanisoli]
MTDDFLPGVPAAPGARLDGFEEESLAGREIALIDLLDRLLSGGAVLTGDLVLSIADVDLVHINLRAVIRSITADDPAPWVRET